MTPKTTIVALKPEMRILVAATDEGIALARSERGAQVATVAGEPIKVARRVKVSTDLGDVEASPTARVLLAPADAPAAATPAQSSMPTIAVVTVDAVGRLTPDSVVSVGTSSAPVPELVDTPGGSFGLVRLGYTLAELGYRAVSPWVAKEDGLAAEVERVSR